jgi:hypothetical protein
MVVDTGALPEVRMTFMVRLVSLCVYVVAILTVHAATMAQDAALPQVEGLALLSPRRPPIHWPNMQP